MHIPSHTLKTEVALSCAAISVPLLAYAFAKARSNPQIREKLPLLAASCAALLGAQAINVAIPGGSSAHLLGGALLAIGFGPWLGMLGMAAVFLVQASLLGDGGLDALGANWLNGAIVAPLLGWAAHRSLTGNSESTARLALSASVAGAVSLLAGAAFCAGELALSGLGSVSQVLDRMATGSYAWAALEGSLTGIAIFALAGRRLPTQRPMRVAGLALSALGIAALVFGGSLSSERPDVLERAIGNLSDSAR